MWSQFVGGISPYEAVSSCLSRNEKEEDKKLEEKK